jgi:hypothetical protein
MQAFLGSFILHFSSACAPLYALLRNQKENKFTLTKEALTAYQSIKEYISQTCMLYHPNFEKPFYLCTDASKLALGAFLYQVEGVTLTETFRYLELCSTCFKEGLGRSKPATNLRTSTLTHCVGFLLYPRLTELSST